MNASSRQPAAVLALLDQWRHLPSYQLERRADIFFALYLPGIIEHALGVEVDARVIPEFPIKREDNNQTTKVDYFLLSKDRGAAFLVEFKTEMDSRNEVQDAYLEMARRRGLSRLLEDIPIVAAASNQKAKYVHLLHALSDLGLLALPDDLDDYAFPKARRGITGKLEAVRAIPTGAAVEIVYLQPRRGDEGRVVSFDQVAAYLRTVDDRLAATLAEYVERWAEPAATEPP
jgi:hypothetical protein